ncbi:hypothetical protein FACS1894181_02050 [Bacteroidia bacterium]|nr:hypothetical protein FACS1894181_02050 [Bacteroidia bacterium]
MNKNITRWSGLMIAACMVTTSLPAQKLETAITKTFAQEWRKDIPGSVQLRAATNWQPDSTVTYTAAGEKSSKQVYTYDADGKRRTQAFEWENNQWVGVNSYFIISFPSRDVSVSYSESGLSWPHPYQEGGMWFGFTSSEAWDTWDYKAIPTRDSKGNLTKVEFHFYEKANPSNSYMAYSYTISYNGKNQPVLIQGYNRSDLFYKVTYQWDSNGNITLYESSELNTDTNKWVTTETCTSNNGVSISEQYNSWSGERKKTIAKNDSMGNTAIQQFYTWTAGKWYMTHYTVFYPNDLAPAAETGNNNPVGTDNKGGFDVNITIPADSIAGGSFVIKLPDGFTLDSINTKLILDFNGFELILTKQESNIWLFTIKPKATRSYTISSEAGKTLAHIAYTVDDKVKRGEYDITVSNIQFDTHGGNEIVEPAITVPAQLNRWGVSNEVIPSLEPALYVTGHTLYIQSSCAERITIYSINGLKLYESNVPAGTAKIDATSFPKGVLVVRGSSGWTWKAINN